MNLFSQSGFFEPQENGFTLLKGFALTCEKDLLHALKQVTDLAPFRNMVTGGGYKMSAAMTNCGAMGWVSDTKGYRYTEYDPETGKHWPELPQIFLALAQSAAAKAGFPPFMPTGCLINRYAPKTKMSLHQDKDEQDLGAPIVSVSLGLPATFLFGGLKRTDPITRTILSHGDVVVWGGRHRLVFHGIAPVKDDIDPILGRCRINLTFRKAV